MWNYTIFPVTSSAALFSFLFWCIGLLKTMLLPKANWTDCFFCLEWLHSMYGIGMFLDNSTSIPREVCSEHLPLCHDLSPFLSHVFLFLLIPFSFQYYILLCYLIWLLILKILSCVYVCTHMCAHIHMHIWTCAEHNTHLDCMQHR